MTSGNCGGGWTDNIPAELRTLPQWVGRRGKMPLNPLTGKGAKAGKPSTWGTFEQAILGVKLGTFDGIGFEFATGGGIVGIDLDHVVDPETGEVQSWALEIVQRMDSYTEYSPSGTGLHIFVRGDIPSSGRKKTLNKDTGEAVEMYKEKRYFTVTGSPFLPAPITDRPAELAALYTELFPAKQTHAAPLPAIDAPEYLNRGLERDKTFRALWDGQRGTGDESSNDLALMNKLAYWCSRDEERMIEAFLSSPHASQKDDKHLKKLERDDYLRRTAQKAVADCQRTAAEDDAAYQLERARQAFAPVSQDAAAPEIAIDPAAETADDMLTGAVISAIFAIPDELAREREIVRLRGIAKEKRFVQDFDALIKAARAQVLKAQKQTEGRPPTVRQTIIHLPDIPLQGLACPEGWIVDRLGVRRFCDGSVEWACSHPVIITERLENIDSGIASLTLSFFRDGHWKSIPVKCSTAANRQSIISLADCGVLVNSESARSLVRFLHDLEAANAETIPLRKSIDRAGWIGDGEFFPFSPGYTYDGDTENRRRLNAMVTAGSEDVWREAIRKAKAESPIFRAMLAVSFAAPLLEPMGNLCFVMHLWGQSGTAKTVATMAAMSVWGDPDILLQSFGGSRIGMERLAAFYHNMPLALDERETSKGGRDDSFDQTIYMLTEGHSAPKGTRTGGLRKSDYWKLPIISTGEAPLVADNSKGGAKNRVLEVRVSENLFPDAPAMADLVKQNYGWAGSRWIDALISERKKDNLKDMRTMYKVIYSDLDKENLYTDKQMAAMSLVLLADYYSDLWIFQNDTGTAIKSTLQFAKDMAKHLVTKQEADTVENAWSFIQGWIAGNKNHFNSLYDECWGVFEEFDTYVISGIFTKVLNEAGYNARMCATGFKEKGYIWTSVTEKKLVVKKRINGIPVWCYRLRIKGELHNQSSEFPSYLT